MVATILELLEADVTYREIRAGYPKLTPAHIHAAIQFAREMIQDIRLITLHPPAHALSHR